MCSKKKESADSVIHVALHNKYMLPPSSPNPKFAEDKSVPQATKQAYELLWPSETDYSTVRTVE
jgi:hypothetical protein